MENVFSLLYRNGDMIPIDEGVVFKCPIDPKIITISEDMLLVALRKTIFYANRGYKILIHVFYCQPNYVGDGCVAYHYMELKHDNDVGIFFSSIQNIIRKVWLSCMQFWVFSRGNPCPAAQTKNGWWDNYSDVWLLCVVITQSSCCHFF